MNPNEKPSADDVATGILGGCIATGCLGGPALIVVALVITLVAVLFTAFWPLLILLIPLGILGWWLQKREEKKPNYSWFNKAEKRKPSDSSSVDFTFPPDDEWFNEAEEEKRSD